jgi:hypothetical protein
MESRHSRSAGASETTGTKMLTPQPIVIRGRGTSSRIGIWVGAAFITGLLLLAAINVRRTGGATLVAAVVPAVFGGMLLYTATLRVVLSGDEISFEHFFRRRRSLRLDQIRSVRGTVRSRKGGPFTYLVIEPIDPQTPPMKIRTDFFSHADVQTIRNFFGDKLKRYGKKDHNSE